MQWSDRLFDCFQVLTLTLSVHMSEIIMALQL